MRLERGPSCLPGRSWRWRRPAPPRRRSPRTRREELGREAYRYGIPLLEFLRIRREMTSVKRHDGRGNAPVNALAQRARLRQAERPRRWSLPTTDTLYSLAQLDLGKGPIVLSHPGMGRRYFGFQFVDPYTNVIGYVGTRTTGTNAGRFQIAWTGKPGKRLRGVPVIRSEHRRVWMIGRTLATDAPADQRRAHAKMRRYSALVGPGAAGAPAGEAAQVPAPEVGPGPAGRDGRSARRQPAAGA